MIKFGQLAPDQPILGSEFASVALNVVPKTTGSYGPLNDLGAVSAALSARCQGGFSCKDPTGAAHIFLADATTIQEVTGATLDDLSGTTYACGSEEFWEFIDFDEFVIATNQADNIQAFQFGTSANFGDLSAAAPRAKHIAKINPAFVVAGNLPDLPNGVHWGEIDDPTSWPTLGTAAAAAAQSNRVELKAGGEVQRIVGAVGGADGLVFMQNALYRMQYVGSPSVFDFFEIERGRGMDAPQSVVNFRTFALYLGVEGFMKTDGAGTMSIGHQRVNQTFLDDLDNDFVNRVIGCPDPVSTRLFWFYPSVATGGGALDRAMIYDYALDRFTKAVLSAEYAFQSMSAGLTLEDLDAISASLDALPLSLDHRAWAGGRGSLGVVNTAHKLCYFTGSSLAAEIETGEFDSGNQRVFVQGVRPLVDTDAAVTAAIGYRDTPGGTRNYTTATARAADGVCPQRISTRYANCKIAIPAGATWSHAQGIEALFRSDGRR